MNAKNKLLDKYTLARCCSPQRADPIVGYFSFDDHIKVHRSDCGNLAKAEPSRLVKLEWDEVLDDSDDTPPPETTELDQTDLAILRHHRDYDIDYSLKVARMVGIDKQTAFDRHQKLRNLGLIERVEALMVQYRKKTAPNKWIKHRNHTYYRLTPKGAACLASQVSDSGEGS